MTTMVIDKQLLEERMAKSGKTYQDFNIGFGFNIELLVKLGARVSMDVARVLVKKTNISDSVLNIATDIACTNTKKLSYDTMSYIYEIERKAQIPFPDSLRGSMELAQQFVYDTEEVTKKD